ncbi:hypothetical protein BV375_15050 [Nostoc sp. 106C]|nr:hypothetical protein BV375_15050 [Nostoc sp. 106C]
MRSSKTLPFAVASLKEKASPDLFTVFAIAFTVGRVKPEKPVIIIPQNDFEAFQHDSEDNQNDFEDSQHDTNLKL